MAVLILLAALTTSLVAPSNPRQQDDSVVALARAHGKAMVVVNLGCPIFGAADLTRFADIVVYGSIAAVQSRLSFDERTVVTEYEVLPSRILKGPVVSNLPGLLMLDSLRAVVPGGIVFHEGLEIAVDVDVFPAAERLHTGEEVVLFLTAHESELGIYRVGGCGSGGFRVVEGRVVAMLRSVAIRRGDQPESLARFLERVQRLVPLPRLAR
jgi:hypothetical protein